MNSEFDPICIINIYAPNDIVPRGEMWGHLSSKPTLTSIICGEFNMVEHKGHSAKTMIQ